MIRQKGLGCRGIWEPSPLSVQCQQTSAGIVTRLRLTADGKMKNCLFAEKGNRFVNCVTQVEIDVIPLIHQNIRSKAKELGGQFTTDFEHLHPEEIHNRSMITIGG